MSVRPQPQPRDDPVPSPDPAAAPAGDDPAADQWIRSWAACGREIESWFDDEQMLAELGRRCALVMLGCHPELARDDIAPQVLLRRLLAADWLAPALTCGGPDPIQNRSTSF